MNIKLISIFALLGAPLLAQNHLTTPPTGTDVDGNDAAFVFGWAANQVHRLMDYTHAGTARSVKSVMFRADYRDHNSIGRTWSNVKVYAAHGDYSSIQYNKSNAYKLMSTPTKVFDARWSFPALSGKPVFNPASWGGVQSSLRFRYASPWMYNGKDSMFLEFRFAGGVAANNQPWIGSTPKGFEYYLDSMSQADWRGNGKGGGTSYGNSTSCFDSAFSNGKGTAARLNLSLTGTTQIALAIQSYYTAPKNPVIFALGLAGSTTGIDIGARCNKLHVAAPLFLLPQSPPYNKAGAASLTLKGVRQSYMKEFWAQAGWADSTTGGFKLTNAVKVTQPTGGSLVPYVASYQVGTMQVWTATKGLPYTRYEY